MDLSGLIFVALAVAWAAYLIPMALKRTDDLATTRNVEDFSSRLRVFGGRRSASQAAHESAEASVSSASVPSPQAFTSLRPVDRAAVRRAAARRRKVLYVLTALLVIVAAVAGFGYAPLWSIGAPVLLIIAFLVIARVTVRRERAGRTVEVITPAAQESPASGSPAAASPATGPQSAQATTIAPSAASSESVEASDVEDTMTLTAQALAGIGDEATTDAGSLWDPLPITLPTYVTKPRARRTVRTIELTQSSGHDAADTKLARDAEAARAKALADKAADEEAKTERRKAAGA